MATLNTNTRYLHANIVEYAERLAARLPDPLSVCFFVNSGSEANDLAMRLAQTHTDGTDTIVVEGAYHGNLSSLIDISPYKFAGSGGNGKAEHVHVLPMPDGFRGEYRYDDDEIGQCYAEHAKVAVAELRESGRRLSSFICESLLSCGGQIVLPIGYLENVYREVRAAGGVCIADEVQVGFGRIGSHFWGFQHQGVVPDIVTMGKPIGNGHPLAAVITTPEIARSFNNGMEYFNTFGGNPVSSAAGLAVLQVIEEENLQQHAAHVGTCFIDKLSELKERHAVIGDVRGLGLFLGIEFVLDRKTQEPAAELASRIVERAKERGVLLSTDGPLHNVIKIKPPLVFSREMAEQVVSALDEILSEEC